MDESKNTYLIPASIVVAGVLIAFAVLYTGGVGLTGSRYALTGDEEGKKEDEGAGEAAKVRLPDRTDRILGNPEAPVQIVEFSDLECPFCKQFHVTMKQIMEEYGKDGKVAWIYRHLPLETLHPKAIKESEAAECAFELGGNEKFWAYVDRVFEVTPSNNGLPFEDLPKIAEHVGLDRKMFSECLASGRHVPRIRSDIEDAAKAGARGTPYSVVIVEGKTFHPVGGALPFAQMKTIVEQALKGSL